MKIATSSGTTGMYVKPLGIEPLGFVDLDV